MSAMSKERSGQKGGAPLIMALEPRLMFDGAAAGEAAHAVDASAHTASADVPAPVTVRDAQPDKNGGKKEAAFIDTSLADFKTLEAGLPEGVAIVEIDSGQEGLAQIAQWARDNSGYDAVHILSHGSEAEIRLGTETVSLVSLATPDIQAELTQIGQALSVEGDLLLYGCDVAQGKAGQDFVAALARITGADVAASRDITGPAAASGNWILEVENGGIETRSVAPADYQGLLPVGPTTTVTSAALSADTGSSSTDWITKTADQTISGTLSAALGAGEKVEVSLDNGATWADASSYSVGSTAWSTTATLSGSNTFQGRVSDGSASGTALSQAYILDTTAPAAPSVAISADTGANTSDGITKTATQTVTVTAEAGAAFYVNYGDNTTGSGSGSHTFTSDGKYTIWVSATDVAGNTSEGGTLIVVVDRSAPTDITPSQTVISLDGAAQGATLATLRATDATAISDYTDAWTYTVTGGPIRPSSAPRAQR